MLTFFLILLNRVFKHDEKSEFNASDNNSDKCASGSTDNISKKNEKEAEDIADQNKGNSNFNKYFLKIKSNENLKRFLFVG